jgi:hypothetical protein
MFGQSPGPQNRRQATRKALSRYAARAVFADGARSIWCEVVDISKSGAKLSTEQVTSLPDQFLLMLSTQGSARRNCRVVWRGSSEVGVRFF